MKASLVCGRSGFGDFAIQVHERVDVCANLVILARDTNLQLAHLVERLVGAPSLQQLPQPFETKIRSRQHLYVAVVECSRDFLTLCESLQFTHPDLEDSAL